MVETSLLFHKQYIVMGTYFLRPRHDIATQRQYLEHGNQEIRQVKSINAKKVEIQITQSFQIDEKNS